MGEKKLKLYWKCKATLILKQICLAKATLILKRTSEIKQECDHFYWEMDKLFSRVTCFHLEEPHISVKSTCWADQYVVTLCHLLVWFLLKKGIWQSLVEWVNLPNCPANIAILQYYRQPLSFKKRQPLIKLYCWLILHEN